MKSPSARIPFAPDRVGKSAGRNFMPTLFPSAAWGVSVLFSLLSFATAWTYPESVRHVLILQFGVLCLWPAVLRFAVETLQKRQEVVFFCDQPNFPGLDS